MAHNRTHGKPFGADSKSKGFFLKSRDITARLKKWTRHLENRVRILAGKLPLPEDGSEAIDLSVPSIPYYTNLATRFSLASLILFLLTFIFLVAALVSNRSTLTYANLYYLVKDINASALSAQTQADTLEYPVSVTTPAFIRYRGGLVSVGSEEVTVLSGSGKQTLSVNVRYGTPAVTASDKYFITYGIGEYSYSVFNSFTLIRNETSEYPIFGAAVADDGSFAIVTRSKTYTSETVFYDKDMQKTADYHQNGYVTSVAMNPAGTNAVITAVEESDGKWISKIVLLRLSGRITSQVLTIENDFSGIGRFIADDRIAVVYPNRIQVIRTDGIIVTDTAFSEQSISLSAVTENRIGLVLTNDSSSFTQTVLVLDKNGKQVYSKNIDTKAVPTQIAFGGHILFLRAGGRLYRLSEDGSSFTYSSISRETVTFLPCNAEQVLICGMAYATRLNTDSFAKP